MRNSKNVQKWQETAKRDKFWTTGAHRKIKDKEVEIISRLLIENKINTVLELGCGDGYVGSQILKRNPQPVSWTFTDLLLDCVRLARKNCLDKRAKFAVVDAHNLTQHYPKKSVECIISTGYASVATYHLALPHVAEVLRPGGHLIVDFVNHFEAKNLNALHKSMFKFFSGRSYHLGSLGIAKFFANYKLKLKSSKWVYNPFSGPFICHFVKE